MPDHSDSSFYVTGGTLRQDAPSYVERRADVELFDGLLKREFCYVLTSRQMGKSSLMVRTAGKLREKGIHVAVLDLTAIGQNLTPEQWYDGLMLRMGRQLRLEDELEDFWEANRQLGPCQRFFTALRDVALAQGAVISNQCSVISQSRATDSVNPPRLVIFVDELDVVRSLPFSTDEFFAAIRECYTRRTEDAQMNRLTFCLLGVATPSDLIRDTRITPFNIGRRIELNDFTPAEAAPLAKGLVSPRSKVQGPKSLAGPESELGAPKSELLLSRILYWTNGHPYLTQRLCQAIAADAESRSPESVDQICEGLFLSRRAREEDDNLLFVRDRLLRAEGDLAALLHHYEQVHRGKRVPHDETNPLVNSLRLSGIVRPVEGELQVRNRIYERVFDRQWIRANMPDAEVRRQQAAFYRGVFRATAVAVVVLAVMAGLVFYARQQAQQARHNLYDADMILAHQALEGSNLGHALRLLKKHLPTAGQKDLRGWEWRYLWQLCRSDELFELGRHSNTVEHIALSPDGRWLATGSPDLTVKVWDMKSRQGIASLEHSDGVSAVAFSPDGKFLATSAYDTVKLWNAKDFQNGHASFTLTNTGGRLAWSPDGTMLATASADQLHLWDAGSWREIAIPEQRIPSALCLAFAPNSATLAFGLGGGDILLWSVPTRRLLLTLHGHTRTVYAVAFSPDGKTLVSGGADNSVRIWDAGTGAQQANLIAHSSFVDSVTFSPDGRALATASRDQSVKLWDAATWRELGTLRGHLDEVWGVVFTPDGQRLVTASKDETIKVWSANPKHELAHEKILPAELSGFRVSADAQSLLTVDSNSICSLWDIATGQEKIKFPTHVTNFIQAALSMSGARAALGAQDGTITVFETAPVRLVMNIKGHDSAVSGLAFSPDEMTLAVASADNAIRLWDSTRAVVRARFDSYPSRAKSLAFSRDGWLLASGHDDGTVEVWDIRKNHRVGQTTKQKSGVGGLALDRKILATGNYDAVARLWDLPTLRESGTLGGQLLAFFSVALSPDRRRLAAGGADGTVKLWDLETRQEVMTLKGHKDYVTELAFSPDGNTLVSVSADTMRVWHAPPLAGTINK